jgi:UPF0176 protein
VGAAEVSIAAFYTFADLSPEAVQRIRQALEEFARERGLKGLVVLGTEGLNATVAGEPTVVADLKTLVRALVSRPDLEFKDSLASKPPFARFKVDVRQEIITTKDLSIRSEESSGTHLSPAEWHEMIATDPDVVLVDTRNDYEVEVGTFEGAIDPKIKKFSEFQRYVEDKRLPKDKKLLMFCTGGIRCEKAVPEVKRLGYENVYQLQGGILRYLEEYPEGFFKGECFVFDHRVAVDKHLQPSKRYALCPHCGNPAQERISCGNCGKDAVICHHCRPLADKNTCSKNCAYHVRRKAA